MTLVEPLNLEMNLVNTFAGGSLIFSLIAIGVIAYWSSKFRMNNLMTGVSVMVFSLIMGQWFGWLYAISVLLGGLMIGYSVAKFVKQ